MALKISPLEAVILAGITVMCSNSVYNLLYGRIGFQAATLSPVTANTVDEGRAPASIAQTFVNIEHACDSHSVLETTGSKARILGPLCGYAAGSATQLVKTELLNTSTQFSATVFTDLAGGKFSTDYIPLNSGQNKIKLQFAYSNGKTVAQEFTINKK